MSAIPTQLRNYITKYTPFSDADWAAIASKFSKIELPSDALVLEEGKICRYLYFLECGLLRYYILKDGAEVTKYFTEAPYCFTSQVSFTAQVPARESIQALEPSEIWQITLDDTNALLNLPSWSTFVRKLIQEVQYYTEVILQELQTETAEQRYWRMLHEQDPLLQRVPLKYLASYLGIAPQSLSHIRRKIAEENRT